MPENIQQALPLILLAIALLVVAWVMVRSSRKTKIIDKQEGDVLDEGASPASRNQALIDTAPAASADAGIPVEYPQPEQATNAASTPPPAPTNADDLKRIKGLGPKLVTLLAEQGITSFNQIAAWSDADVKRIDATLGRFSGRITRDQWVEQAKLLSAGDEDSFSKSFGNNG